jgi:galactonate dehydratase
MKITGIRTHPVYAKWRNYVFVELITDDEEIVGIGEATMANNQNGVQGAIFDLQKYVIGQDPFDIEKIWRSMAKGPFWRGGAIFTTAISGIDQALWDIMGKSLKVPAYKLLGGRYRENIRLYANGWFSGNGTPKQYADAALKMTKRGFDALKFDPFDMADMTLDPETEKSAVDITKAVREAVGPKVDLLIEAHGRFTPRTAIRIGKKLERYDPFWFEEPCPPEDFDGLVRVGREVDIPIASGERLFTRWDYWNLIEKRAADIIQPDVCHVGGISELKKVATMAETKNILVAPHNSNGAVSTAAAGHLLTTMPNGLILEYWVDVPWREEVVKEKELVSKGKFRVSEKPGLGVELNFAEIKRHPAEETHIDFFTKYVYH